jgi:trans-aconitate methyltransferase
MAHERIIGLYERTAGAWDEARRGGPSPEEKPHLEAFAAALPRGAALLDIGCGGGIPVARDLIAAGFGITGIDSSPALIALCRERFPQAEWQVADMRSLDLGRCFDGLIAWHSFFHLRAEDQRAMFPIFAAHAAPGALLTFTSGPLAGVAMGEWQGEPLFHDSLAQDEYRALLAANGFEILRFTAGIPIADGPTVWLARRTV